ncbi:thioredoxin reductase-like selenoprotein T homolog CG3887 [Onthophagus taurus]|uniref:thioredoxin reductase-like selenoprotein T homolog CG3887 n=1 Tax=Onthophagus taurus TaxID=166361 RepID=UPI0039BDE697
MHHKIAAIRLAIVLVLCVALAYSESNDQVPVPKFSQNVATLKVLYCYSCGYRKAFDEYASIIQQKYPDIIIDGRNYDPPGLNMFLARLLGVLKLMVIVCILGGVNIFNYINQVQPSWWEWCIQNKMYSVLMLFFLSNIIESQLIQSGAFEISLNDVPVWSKLETGRIPQPAELFQIIDSQMQFTADLNSGFAK